jgi:predicted nucleic acid-binding protein
VRQGLIVGLDEDLARAAAVTGLQSTLPLADSIVLATSQTHNATLWTQDADFRDIPNVRYIPKR